MINEAKSGIDRRGNPITDLTPDLPGVFLTEEQAIQTVAEQLCDVRERLRIDTEVIRCTDGWLIHLWVVKYD